MENNKYNSENLSKAKLWMLALSAVLTEMNGCAHDNLYGREKTEKLVDLHRHILKRDWDISNREELMNSLNWLLEEGHLSNFTKPRYFLSTLSESAQNMYLSGISKKSNKYAQYHIVKAYDKKLPKAGTVAWDYGRYTFLCRDGAYLQYISDEEAWELMLKVAKLAQKSYSSWKEYALAYIAGRQLWLGQVTKESTENQVKYINKLLFDKDSPWFKVDWNTNLE